MKNILFVLFISFSISLFGQTNEKDYYHLTSSILAKRNNFNKAYSTADSTEQQLIINQAREYLFETITVDLFSNWYGTKWDFFGDSKIPHLGSVSAGNFVTNILTDAGFIIPKEKWSKPESTEFIRVLSPNKIGNLSNKTITELNDYLLATGDGLYIIGLDKHIGFIIHNKGQIRFVHASYYQPEIGVMNEELDSWNPLKNSKHRILGKLLTDDMMIHWLNILPYK